MSVLAARDGYRLWAPDYETETAVSRLEDLTVGELGVPTAGRSLLDVGCGTGRRLDSCDAAVAIGVDLTIEMLAAAGNADVASADAHALPFPSGSFDVVWCRLMIGHVSAPELIYTELARVCRASGIVVVSDLSPAAVHAGHRRTFRDGSGVEHELEHFAHSADTHTSAAHACGLRLDTRRVGIVGPSISDYYVAAGRSAAYEAQRGRPLVHAFAWRKEVAS